MPKWQATNNKIRYNSRFRDNRVLFLAHNTVKYKLEFAFFHITVLHKAYNLQPTSAKTLLKRSMIENVILNLSSALDAIAHEINQINNFGIDFHRVAIDHKHRDQFYKYCMRCKLDQSSHHLSHYLNIELPQKKSESDATNWYFDFQKYRNQMVHKTIYVLMLEPGKDFLPDDPAILDPPTHIVSSSNIMDPIYPNYTKRRELKVYSKFCLEKVLCICEKIYGYLQQQM